MAGAGMAICCGGVGREPFCSAILAFDIYRPRATRFDLVSVVRGHGCGIGLAWDRMDVV